jgi:nucleotide-binding universal stress UspA family protein
MQQATPNCDASPKIVSLKRVLVAVDFSETSEKAMHHAVAIARRYGAKFYLAHVVSSLGSRLAPYESRVRASELALQYLKHLEARLIKNGVLAGLEHDVMVAIGDVWEEIKQLAINEKVDLIVVGTHGRTGLSRVVMGSAAEAVFRHASRPVLTVGPCVSLQPRKLASLHRIVYPTDFTSESVRALRYALSLAQEHEAELTLLHVLESVNSVNREARHDMARVNTVLQDRLRALLPSSFRSTVASRTEVVLGPIDESVLEFANTQSSDLIVLGLKHRAALSDHLPWLHAYRIVSGACCPVLTIRSA